MPPSPVLHDELLMEILSRVQVKDLFRFRRVSKWFHFLVIDPIFIKLHLLRASSQNTHILLTFQEKLSYNNENRYCAPCSVHDLLHNPSSAIHALRPFNLYDYKFLGVCNGLVCLIVSYSHYDHDHEFEQYCVRFWNPSTRFISQDSPLLILHGFSFRFGFGYDDLRDTYKVVVLDTKSDKTEVIVHCLGDTCWINTITCPGFPILNTNAASVSGTVNWLALLNLNWDHRWKDVTMKDLVIFSYDLTNDSIKYLSMPAGLVVVPLITPTLEVLKGCLCLAFHRGRSQFDFWLMKEFGVEESWTRLLNISYEQIDISGHVLVYAFPNHPRILCLSKDEDEDEDAMVPMNVGRWKLSMYNHRDKIMAGYRDWNKSRFKFLSYDYVQSLVMPYGN